MSECNSMNKANG